MNGTVNQLVLVTSGNRAMVTAGTALITTVGGKVKRNLLGGQLFAANRHTLVAIDNTTLAASNVNDLIFGVGIDKDGDGLAESWRSINLAGFGIATLEAEPPRCGLPGIKDFLFKCTDFEEFYNLDIEVQNNLTRSFMPMHRGDRFSVGIDTDASSGCQDCTAEHNCKEIACKIQDFFNQKILEKYPNWKPGNRNFPFYAKRLFPNDYVFCFSASDSTCANCTHVTALESFEFDGGNPILFTNHTNPDDNTETLMPQLQTIADQINDELGANGSAVLVKGTGGCCAYQLRVNTCFDDFVLTSSDVEEGAITPCDTSNPLEAIPVDDTCPSCPAGEAETVTYDCGVRFILKPEILECNCQYPTLPPKAYFSGNFDIFPTEGWANGKWTVVTVQEPQLPENFGYWIKWLEYSQSARNLGKGVTEYNQTTGYAGLPRHDSRIANAVSYADCKKDYCTFDLTHRRNWSKGTNAGIDAGFHSVLEHVKVAIPNGDSTTKTSVQNFWTALVALVNARGYNQLATVTCASDQDQGGGYVEPNGAITEI